MAKSKNSKGKKRELTLVKNGIVALLCSPSDLNLAWTRSPDDKVIAKIEYELGLLPLSDEEREDAMALMTRLMGLRGFFRGIADTVRDAEYDGNEPHPPRAQAAEIIKRLM